MKNYEIEQSNYEVQKVYSQLIDKLTEHVKLLSLNGKPITTVMGLKRALIRMKKITPPATGGCHLPNGEDMPSRNGLNETKISNEEELLAMEILECMGIDIKPAVEAGLLGLREMKKSMIRFHYDRIAKTGMKYKDIKAELSKKYNMSEANIEKMVYRQGSRKNHLRQRKADTSPEGKTGPHTKMKENGKG
jgi:hypothetical protein